MGPDARHGSQLQNLHDHSTAAGNSWIASAFSGYQGTWAFTPTRCRIPAGQPTHYPPAVFTSRLGVSVQYHWRRHVNAPVQADSITHFNNLIAKLGSETGVSSSE